MLENPHLKGTLKMKIFSWKVASLTKAILHETSENIFKLALKEAISYTIYPQKIKDKKLYLDLMGI